MSRVFIDTNVFMYADDADSPEKRALARPIIREHLAAGTGVVSTQVLTEYFAVATRKLSIPSESAHLPGRAPGVIRWPAYGRRRLCLLDAAAVNFAPLAVPSPGSLIRAEHWPLCAPAELD